MYRWQGLAELEHLIGAVLDGDTFKELQCFFVVARFHQRTGLFIGLQVGHIAEAKEAANGQGYHQNSGDDGDHSALAFFLGGCGDSFCGSFRNGGGNLLGGSGSLVSYGAFKPAVCAELSALYHFLSAIGTEHDASSFRRAPVGKTVPV